MQEPQSNRTQVIALSSALCATGHVCAELADRTNAIQAAVSIPSLVTGTDSETAKLIQDLDFLSQALQAIRDITEVLAASADQGFVAEQDLLSAAHLSRLQKVFKPSDDERDALPGDFDLF